MVKLANDVEAKNLINAEDEWGGNKLQEFDDEDYGNNRMLMEEPKKTSYKPNASSRKPMGTSQSTIQQKSYTGLSLPKVTNTPTYTPTTYTASTTTASSSNAPDYASILSSVLPKQSTYTPTSSSVPLPKNPTPTTYKPAGGKTGYGNTGKSGYSLLFS